MFKVSNVLCLFQALPVARGLMKSGLAVAVAEIQILSFSEEVVRVHVSTPDIDNL